MGLNLYCRLDSNSAKRADQTTDTCTNPCIPQRGRRDMTLKLTSGDILWIVYIYSHIYTNIWILTVKTDNAEEPIFLAMETQNKAVRQINQVHQSANSYIWVNLSVRCHKGP